jgi:hypothetical protein
MVFTPIRFRIVSRDAGQIMLAVAGRSSVCRLDVFKNKLFRDTVKQNRDTTSN